jgi:hypothetical protein
MARTTRIQYGTEKTPLSWIMKISDAKSPVTVKGTLKDALLGTPGVTIGCHLSNCAINNQKAFPHPVIFAAFSKSVCYIIKKFYRNKQGRVDGEAVRYRHELGEYVDLNDKDHSKTFIRNHPELVEREFTLYKPQRRSAQVTYPRKGNSTGERIAVVPRGAYLRAYNAKLIDPGVKQLLDQSEKK